MSDNLGQYRFETVLPGRYTDAGGTRPAHLHAMVLTPGGNPLLTTQLHFAGDPFLGRADYCTAPAHVQLERREARPEAARRHGLRQSWQASCLRRRPRADVS